MSNLIRIADYFFVASIHVDKKNLEADNPDPVIVDRFPKEDYEDTPFTENAEFFCLPEGAKVEFREGSRRKPYIFTFCFTQADGSQSYGTSLVFYELLCLDGKKMYNKYNQELYIPKALCVLSLMPFFTCHSSFLKYVYNSTITEYNLEGELEDDEVGLLSNDIKKEHLSRMTSLSFADKDGSASFMPVERVIQYYIEELPYYKPGYSICIPLTKSGITLSLPPSTCLPFCDPLCMKSLLSCLSMKHIESIVSALLQDGKVLMHSNDKYQLTLCSTALLSLMKPVHYTLTYIPLLPAQLIDYIEAPTPYMIGIYTKTFSLSQTEELECVLVDLAYDKLYIPKTSDLASLSLPYMNLFSLSYPIAYNVLYTYPPNSKQVKSAIFTMRIGPGPLGLKLRKDTRQLCYSPPGEPTKLEDVVYIDSEESSKLSGSMSIHMKECEMMMKDPAIVAVNGVSLLNMPLKKAITMIAACANPRVLTLQIGLCDIPRTVSYETNKEFNSTVPQNVFQRLKYYEDVRIVFFVFFCNFFKSFKAYYQKRDGRYVFDQKGFVKSFEEDMREFASRFCQSQLFEGLFQMLESVISHKESQDDELASMTKLMLDTVDDMNMAEKKGESIERVIERVRDRLSPSNWIVKKVILNGILTTGLSSELTEMLLIRDPSRFPRLDDRFYMNHQEHTILK